VSDKELKFKKELLVLPVSKLESTDVSVCEDKCCASTGTAEKLGPTINQVELNQNFKTYFIQGMDCSSCALTLENHLRQNPRVKNVTVNFSTAKMHIEHENSIEDIIKEVGKTGYKAIFSSKNRTTPIEQRQNHQPAMILSGVLLLLGFIHAQVNNDSLLTTILYACSVAIGGYKPARSAFYAVKSRSLDMNVLMTIAAIGAVLIGEWLEGATVVWLFALGNALQTSSIERTRNSIRSLFDLTPPIAWVKRNDELFQVPVDEIQLGEIITVRPGDRVALDGKVVTGFSTVNQAPITGESIPVEKQVGDTVYAGTINEHGTLDVKVTKHVEDSAIANIIHLVEEAQEQKAPAQAFVDKFAKVYTPIVFVLALATIVLPPIFGMGSWSEWFYRGLELLVVACPCALVISTPVAIVSAIGNAAKNGVLIKGGTSLETAGRLSSIAFDKTGTLTEGKPKVTSIFTYGIEENELLSIARTLEESSSHPIAQTIVRYAKDKGVSNQIGGQFNNIVGKGVQGHISGIEYFAGNLKLFKDLEIPITHIEEQVEQLQSSGHTIIIIGTADTIKGIIAVSDSIRETTLTALTGLQSAGLKEVVMLTGDNEGTAKKIALQANVSRYFAEMMPEDKVAAIKKLQSEGHIVAMVGDGINDAPALAASDLGIAMGGAGTDTALETADVVLMADHLEKLPHTIKLSRKAMRIIKQNIWFSILIKGIALTLIFPGWLTLWIAVLSDTGAAVLVILNSMRLLRFK
jgi:Cd2+/Zn2+-exporting ATPase